jgi:hypothetical protein
MDEVHQAAQALEKGLANFNEKLRTAFGELEKSHSLVKPMWNDTMGRDYERSWRPLCDAMTHYNQVVGKQYHSDMDRRLKHLTAYLHGR